MNTIETATIIQSELDKAAVEQATSGWMEVNEKLVKYTGGAEVKIRVSIWTEWLIMIAPMDLCRAA